MRVSARVGTGLALMLWFQLAGLAGAQTLEGELIEQGSAAGIRGASVLLLDSAGTLAATTLSDDRGRFVFSAAPPGRYRLTIRRLGYAEQTSAPFALPARGTLSVRLELSAAPVELAPVEVRVRPAEPRRSVLGMDTRTVGGKLLTRDWIEARVPAARHVGDILRWSNMPGLSVEEKRDGSICVVVGRGRGCAEVYLNGSRASTAAMGMVSANMVEEILVLQPSEAGALFGTGAANGVVLVFTRGARAR